MIMDYPIYLDNNATTPCDPQVVEAMLPFFSEHFGNAASKTHTHGWFTEEAVAQAREQIANLIGASVQEIIFTSGATESINLAIQGIAEKHSTKGNHIITVSTEHKAVLDVCEHLQSKGFEITYLGVDATGMIDLEELKNSIRENTILIAAMFANNETGVLLPVAEMGAIAHARSVPFFCDATQAVGKIPVDVIRDNIDMMAFSGHKMYGPKGVGALYVRKKDPMIEISPLFYGGGHERKLRSGTLNVPGIVGIGKAAELCKVLMQEESAILQIYRDKLWNAVRDVSGVQWNGNPAQSLPHVANICFSIPGGDNLIKLLTKHMSVSSGSACSSATVSPSHVLKAMGRSDIEALSSIRFSFGRFITEQEIDVVIDEVRNALLRSLKKA